MVKIGHLETSIKAEISDKIFCHLVMSADDGRPTDDKIGQKTETQSKVDENKLGRPKIVCSNTPLL